MPEAIKGLDQLERRMKALGLEGKDGKRIFRAALRQSANVIRDGARERVPVKSGLLRRPIKVFGTRGKPGTIRFQVRATARRVSHAYPGDGFPYGQSVEFGHAAPGKRRRLFGNRNRLREIEFGSGFTPPHPFMRPAWEASKDKVLEKLRDEIDSRIQKVEAIFGA